MINSLGNQLKSESSAKIYAFLLRKGVRCLEIDTWDGINGEPVVTHGNTLCTKVPLRQVLQEISKHAFENGQAFPVILSLEDHCSFEQQCIAANLYQEILGEALITSEISEQAADASRDSNTLPTPRQLGGKIILKHKKLQATSQEKSPSVQHFASLTEVGKKKILRYLHIYLF